MTLPLSSFSKPIGQFTGRTTKRSALFSPHLQEDTQTDTTTLSPHPTYRFSTPECPIAVTPIAQKYLLIPPFALLHGRFDRIQAARKQIADFSTGKEHYPNLDRLILTVIHCTKCQISEVYQEKKGEDKEWTWSDLKTMSLSHSLPDKAKLLLQDCDADGFQMDYIDPSVHAAIRLSEGVFNVHFEERTDTLHRITFVRSKHLHTKPVLPLTDFFDSQGVFIS